LVFSPETQAMLSLFAGDVLWDLAGGAATA